MRSKQSATERIIGIDPGIERTGIGIIDVSARDQKLVFVDCIVTDKRKPHNERMAKLAEGLQRILKRFHPTRAAVEKLFFTRNVKTAMAVAEARGVVLLTLHKASLPLSEWTPQQIKQHVTGYGNADKRQVQRVVCMILKLKRAPHYDDATDALACALTAQQSFLTSIP